MPQAAHSSVLKVSGASTVFANEATTCLDPGTFTRYQITDTTKRGIDPSVAIVVEEDDDGAGPNPYVAVVPTTIVMPHGIVIFAVARQAASLVRVSGNYLPQLTVADVREFEITQSRGLLDDTDFDSGGARHRIAGLKDASGSIGGLWLGTEDIDPGAGSVKLTDALANGTILLLEIQPGGSGPNFRAYILLESQDEKASLDGLVEGSAPWKAVNPATAISGSLLQMHGWSNVV